jgi:hypothetical protein
VDRRARKRRLLFALAAALLLHAGVAGVVVVLSRRLAGRRSKQPANLTVELREVKRAPPAPPPPVPAPKPAPLAEKPRREGSAQPGVVAQPTPHAATRPPAAPPQAAPSAPAAPLAGQGGPANRNAPAGPTRSTEGGAQAPSGAGGGAPGGGTPGQGLSLQLRDPGAVLGGKSVPDELPGPERVPSREEKLAEEQARVQGRVEGWLNDDAARLRVRDAREGYWQELEDKLAKDFHIEWDVLDQGQKGPGGPARFVSEAAQQWQRAAGAYGKDGNPAKGDPNGPGAKQSLSTEWASLPPAERGARGDAALGNTLAPSIVVGGGGPGGGGAFHHRLAAYVMITQAEDGSIQEIHLEGGSGNRTYDRLALAQARTLTKNSLGAPPHGHRRSLWSFETDFMQAPPFPIAGCGLDAFFIPRDCFYPFKKKVKTQLHLEALY